MGCAFLVFVREIDPCLRRALPGETRVLVETGRQPPAWYLHHKKTAPDDSHTIWDRVVVGSAVSSGLLVGGYGEARRPQRSGRESRIPGPPARIARFHSIGFGDEVAKAVKKPGGILERPR